MKANRRKLIKGSLAAPMIFTLGPATGWAQAINSAGVCLQRGNLDIADAGTALTDHADEWVRKQVTLLKLSMENGDGLPTELKGTYIHSYDGQTYYLVPEDGIGTPVLAEYKVGQEKLIETPKGTAYALLRIAKPDPNANAEVTGFAWEGVPGTVASFACANSAGLIAAAAANLLKVG